jgi:hypothetical protein
MLQLNHIFHQHWNKLFVSQHGKQRSLEQFQKAVQIDPNYAKAYFNWGEFSLGVELEKAVENPAGSEAKPERSRDPSMAGKCSGTARSVG